MTLIRNRYRQVRQLAQTTYGGIYLCNDEFLRPRRVVLKSVSLVQAINMLDLRSPELQAPDDPRQEKTFALLQRSEAAPHPNIVQYLDDFIEGHTLYFVLEYCAGGDLVSCEPWPEPTTRLCRCIGSRQADSHWRRLSA
ncbi:hypothetical protein PC110_g5632 [Phytophthora cactorum]|uniref:Protein kinase domain-containing protein n=1 Tax=Phytophthora cactorum TaxID=29920 RepID=A0A329SQW3_9STRA|nr:hypothetical protein C6341_g2426 [Phytophthora cactorum]RAW38108.1 hypothetical protein PC110_g5632 [Phytophthora cactorum]